MLKRLLMLVLAVFLLGSAAQAEEYVPPEIPGTWQEFSQSDQDTLYFDAASLVYDAAADTATVLVRTDTANLKETYVTAYVIDYAAGRVRTSDHGTLYKRGAPRKMRSLATTMAITPGTYGEALAKAVAAYVGRDAQRAERPADAGAAGEA